MHPEPLAAPKAACVAPWSLPELFVTLSTDILRSRPCIDDNLSID
jgi:hypothetical protein